MISSAKRHETILQIEALIDEESWLVDGMNLKPLARLVLWSQYKNVTVRTKSFREVLRSSRAGPVASQIRRRVAVRGSASAIQCRKVSSELPGILHHIDSGNGMPSGLFKTPKNLVHTIPGLGDVDRVYSPIGRRLTHETVRIEGTPTLRPTPRSEFRTMSKIKRLGRNLAAYVQSCNLSHVFPDDLASTFYDQGLIVLNSRAWGRDLLSRHKRLSYLAVASWYSPGTMGILAAFSERGIPTIDIQHGQQGPYQSMYVDWSIRWCSEESLIPTEFWVWGRQTQERISHGNPQQAPSSRVIGYPFLADLASWASSSLSSERSALDHSAGRRVVVALQGKHIDLVGVLPEELKRFMRTHKATYVLREHPNSPLTEPDRQYLRHDFPGAVEIDDGRRPLPVVLAGADALISGFSSAVLEAAYMRIPSLVWAPVASDQYSDLISSGVVTADPSQTISLEEIIRQGLQADWSVLEQYISSSVEDLANALKFLEGAVSNSA